MAVNDSRELQIFNETKLRELDYYRESYRRTLKEWKKFIAGMDGIDDSIVPPEVLSAWIRCRDYGIEPLQLPVKSVLIGEKLAQLLKKNKGFIDISRPFLMNLYQFLKGSGFHVVLFDREGYLLEIMGDHDTAEMMEAAGGTVGTLWNERSAGHNTVGTIIEVKAPIQIFGSQHYNKHYHGSTGSGAPIFSPDGELLGGITLTARNCRVNAHTLGMAVAAAYAVENELRTMRAFSECQTAYRYRETVMESIAEAMITVDNFNIVSLVNEPAKRLFSIESGRAAGMSLSALLAKKNAMLVRTIDNYDHVIDKEVQVFSHNSWNDYTLTITPIVSAENRQIGKIIVLNEIKRVKTMVTKMMGARAVYHFEDICGQNSRFLISIEQARMVAQNDSNILLLGKSGTGKDIFAQSIHNASSRKDGPFVAINCGAIPRDLIASELFGHEEGSFTGARRGGSPGKFELAEGGTIFLDEIAELPLELQPVLLRVIEDKSITRIGGKKTRKIDVRIITATNKNLREEIAKGSFREDLFYRVNVFSIELIPLGQRRDDITILTKWFIKKYEARLEKRIRHVDDAVMDAFKRYDWPGNVRELQNVVERMMNLARSDVLTCDLMPEELINSETPAPDLLNDMESREEKERKIIEKMIDLNFQKTEIAEKLNISRSTLYRKFKKYRVAI